MNLNKVALLAVNLQKIALVVINENTLGYISPSFPNDVSILSASTIKGASKTDGSIEINDTVRLASKKDFDVYRNSFDGYEKDPEYIYEGMPFKEATFTYNDKSVVVKNLDPSSPTIPIDKPWAKIQQEVFDQLDDSNVFTNDELHTLAEMSEIPFLALLVDKI